LDVDLGWSSRTTILYQGRSRVTTGEVRSGAGTRPGLRRGRGAGSGTGWGLILRVVGSPPDQGRSWLRVSRSPGPGSDEPGMDPRSIDPPSQVEPCAAFDSTWARS